MGGCAPSFPRGGGLYTAGHALGGAFVSGKLDDGRAICAYGYLDHAALSADKRYMDFIFQRGGRYVISAEKVHSIIPRMRMAVLSGNLVILTGARAEKVWRLVEASSSHS